MTDPERPPIILLGLGPGNPEHLTRQAWHILETAPEVHLRTREHPVVAALHPGIKVNSFDDLYDNLDSFDQVYEAIVSEVLTLGRRPQGVVYAVPGHPYVAEATGPEIVRRARGEGLGVMVVEGISFLEPTWSALGEDPFPRLNLVDALELGADYHPRFPPDIPTIVAQIHSRMVANQVKLTLAATFPDSHPVQLVHAAGTKQEGIEALPLYAIDRSDQIGLLTCLYVPPLAPATSFESFQALIAHLRAPEGCPWDREQTHLSLRPYLLEETYETLAALDAQDPQALKEELGDLLIQVTLHTQIASEAGDFTMAGVLKTVQEKLVFRHPHVFGEVSVEDSHQVKLNWERLKSEERLEKGDGDTSLLAGVPLHLPALAQADAYQKHAARVGFDWPDIEGVFEKVVEELDEVRRAIDPEAQTAELGDLLFAVTNLIRWSGADAETVLREANTRFRNRFSALEKTARKSGRVLGEMSLDEMDEIWESLKK